MLKKSYTLAIIIFLANCNSKPEQKTQAGDSTQYFDNLERPTIDTTEYLESELSETQVEIGEKKIISITDTLFRGDTLRIKFKTPHPRDFAIRTPDDKFFFVVYGVNDEAKPSLVDWTEFETMDYLEIITDRTTANPWDAEESKNKLIFTKTGQYEILLSETLETDDGTPIEVEHVYYSDSKK